jgi:hypothetical protein
MYNIKIYIYVYMYNCLLSFFVVFMLGYRLPQRSNFERAALWKVKKAKAKAAKAHEASEALSVYGLYTALCVLCWLVYELRKRECLL